VVLAMLSRMVRAEVGDEDIRKLFASDPARFGEGVPKASHIMFKTVDAQGRPFAAAEDRKVRARALALREKLVAGEDFAAMAGKYSEDKDTADRGGALGFLDKSRIVDPVAAAAYDLKPGEISQPVKGASGWHLVKVMEIKHVVFDNVKSEVRSQLFADLGARLLRDLVKKVQIEPGPAKL
jgi:parvulin-like peptidyl-prolyl isomerase